jgi:polysaccharide deacetylase family protein (PEP-CTERM system associated)
VRLREALGRAARASVVERDLTWRGNARRVVEAARELVDERARTPEQSLGSATMPEPQEKLHALSFDVEEYFQVANLRGHFRREDWDTVTLAPRRRHGAHPRALERHGARATFFFLGWIAERHPPRAPLPRGGHEIASHGYEHLFLQDSAASARARPRAHRGSAVAAGAPRPIGFRASTFTLTRATWWAFDVLVRRGYRYDSSVHPVRHPVYGVPDFEPGISRVRGAGGELVEFPVSTLPLAGRNLPVGGGGYFRLLPGAITRAALRGSRARGAAGASTCTRGSSIPTSRAVRAGLQALPPLPQPRPHAAAPRALLDASASARWPRCCEREGFALPRAANQPM